MISAARRNRASFGKEIQLYDTGVNLGGGPALHAVRAGNHENEVGNGTQGYLAYQTRFELPDNGSDEFRGNWYAFTVGSQAGCRDGRDLRVL